LNKQKTLRSEYVNQSRKRTQPEYANRKRFEKRREADRGGPPVRFENGSPAPESLRRSPATNHGELEGKKGTGVLRGMDRVGEKWKESTGSTTATTSSSPADGGVG
jgi:hypothetical protein